VKYLLYLDGICACCVWVLTTGGIWVLKFEVLKVEVSFILLHIFRDPWSSPFLAILVGLPPSTWSPMGELSFAVLTFLFQFRFVKPICFQVSVELYTVIPIDFFHIKPPVNKLEKLQRGSRKLAITVKSCLPSSYYVLIEYP